MDTRKVTGLTVTYEDGSTESFVGDTGYVTTDTTLVKDSEGKMGRDIRRVVASVTTYTNDWRKVY